jgi:hypothetical protein
MKSKILFIGILLFGILSYSKSDEKCTDTVISTTSLANEHGCIEPEYQMDINLSEDYIIIRNQVEFSDLVTGSCLPTIDFTIYDLVIGKKGFTTGNSSINYELVEDCETTAKTLTVTFNQNLTTEAPNLTYHRLIPKLMIGEELNVELIVN